MTRTNLVPAAIGKPVAAYSHGVLSTTPERILFTAGQVGIAPDGKIAQGIDAQLEQIYENIQIILKDGGMGMADVVQVRIYLTDQSQVLPNRAALSKWLGSVNPAATTVIVKSLVSPDFLVEIEAVAAR
jgi:enamine deaminase RidA (YjgF/YER057c/UK114 family)